ncbi:TIGR01621 family pseudouridine synthase [Marinobacterium litorale]|uniref:TIGR01621 family pseudouridine synthase n=1 Tax=Marinobacterium litorale TaxID=404770 RepID=UPI000416E76E|nr:TIGR01621 family pseudouridine synthase [Marinobacterium litorale]
MYRLISQHTDFIVIDKFPDISVHRDQAECGLVTRIEADLGRKLWLVHRLDKMTSGLLLLATSKAACEALARQFREHRIEKYYLALCDRKPNKKQGRVIGDMARSRRSGWRLLKSRENPAITEFYSRSAGPGLRLVLCRPATGQTHQIRVALKSLGAPIIGDPLYHESVQPAPDRGYLHAWQLCFTMGDEAFRFIAPPLNGALWSADSVRDAIEQFNPPRQMRWRGAGPDRAPAV